MLKGEYSHQKEKTIKDEDSKERKKKRTRGIQLKFFCRRICI